MNSTTTNFNNDYEIDYIEKVEHLENDRKSKTRILDANSIVNVCNEEILEEFLKIPSKTWISYKIIKKECEPTVGYTNCRSFFSKENNIEIGYENTDDERSTIKNLYHQYLNPENSENLQDSSWNGDNEQSISIAKTKNSSTGLCLPNNYYFKCNRFIDDKIVIESNQGEQYFFSPHTFNKIGDFEILWHVVNIGKNNCFVITEERKNLGDDLRQSGIRVYSLWHLLPIMVKNCLIAKEKMFKIANNLSRFTNQIVRGELLNKALIKIN